MSLRTSRWRRHLVVAALVVIASTALWLCLQMTDRVIWGHEPAWFPGLYPTRLLLLAVTAMAVLAAFAVLVGWPGRSLFARRLHAAGFTTLLLVLLLEAVFMFVPESHNVGYTLASRIWWERHWGSENSLGYRDPEHARVEGKKSVFLDGDSFTAGAGIADPGDRFGNVLAKQRPDLNVLNLGHSGDDTRAEFARLTRHPLRPDVVVLQYYPNDIDEAAQELGHPVPAPRVFADVPSVKLRFLIRSSYLANFVYWQFSHGEGNPYLEFLTAMHDDPAVARRHADDLEKFCTWTGERQVPLVVVLFPLMEDLDWSRRHLAYVKTLFACHHVPVLDVADLIGDLSLDERRNNHHDGHASPEVHRRVGEALAKLVPR